MFFFSWYSRRRVVSVLGGSAGFRSGLGTGCVIVIFTFRGVEIF